MSPMTGPWWARRDLEPVLALLRLQEAWQVRGNCHGSRTEGGEDAMDMREYMRQVSAMIGEARVKVPDARMLWPLAWCPCPQMQRNIYAKARQLRGR